MLWYFHHTRQIRWLTRTVPPWFLQKHYMRNALYVPEYLYVCTPTPPVHTSLHLFLLLWSTTPKLFANFHMRWEIQSCRVQQCLIVKANVLFGAFKTCMLLSSKHLQHWRTLSTVKDHLYHSLANTFWQWLTQTNLRLLAFTLGPLILSRIGVRIYKTYSVLFCLATSPPATKKSRADVRTAKIYRALTSRVCDRLHVEWVGLSFSGQL